MSRTLEVPGASLYYEAQGSGPTLLMIPGGIGDAACYAGIVPILTKHYRVVSYDRRGTSRSTSRDSANGMRIATQVDDARRLLDEIGPDPAYVFGSSGGAIIGLELCIRHPGRVHTLLAHEPPVVTLLPDSAKYLAYFEDVHATYHREGVGPAIRKFNAGNEPELGGDPAPEFVPSPEAELRFLNNLPFFLENELLPFVRYTPDITALKSGSTRIVLAGGELSHEKRAYLASAALAAQLGTEVAEFPGSHTGYMTHATAFARRLLRALSAQ